MSAAKSQRQTHTVLYDDECPMCTFQMRVLTWMDWCNVLTLMPISHPRASAIAPHLTREELREAIHCITREGRIHRGARCLRFVGMRMPALVLPALVLWMPGVIWIAERVYMWISRNRHLLSRLFGCREACTLLPSRRRSREEELGTTPPAEKTE